MKGRIVDEDFILPSAVSAMTGLTVEKLGHLRWYGGGPKFYKPTVRKVLYRRSEVIAWLESCEQPQPEVHGVA